MTRTSSNEKLLPSSDKKYFFISSLAKGLKFLELLADTGALGVSSVAQHLHLNRAGSHRYLSTLRDLGYVEKNGDNRYHLTTKLLELGMKVAGRLEIREAAHPYMEELSLTTGESVNLGYWDRGEILHLDKVNSRELLRMDVPLGARANAYCTGLGKAILAFLPKDELDAYLAGTKLRRHGPNTITSIRKLRDEIETIRQNGFAVDNEELAADLRCVAAPLFDASGLVRYSLSVSGPATRLTPKRIGEVQVLLRETCRGICSQLGARLQAEKQLSKGELLESHEGNPQPKKG